MESSKTKLKPFFLTALLQIALPWRCNATTRRRLRIIRSSAAAVGAASDGAVKPFPAPALADHTACTHNALTRPMTHQLGVLQQNGLLF